MKLLNQFDWKSRTPGDPILATSNDEQPNLQFWILESAFHEITASVSPFEGVGRLVLSRAWRASVQMTKPLLIASTPEDIAALITTRGVDFGRAYSLASLTDLAKEAETATFEGSCDETLLNVRHYCDNPYMASGMFPLAISDERSKIAFPARGTSKNDHGFVYGWRLAEAYAVLQSLFDSGLVEENRRGQGWGDSMVRLTGKGIARAEAMRRRKSIREVFCVMPWEPPDQRAFLESVFLELTSDLGFSVSPVWTTHHNDKIDERIFRKITDCFAVITVVDPRNFNVGMETGYAYAMRKQVIPIRQDLGKDDKEFKMPFDIVTMNCTKFTMDDAGRTELVSILKERIIIELSKAEERL